LNQRPIFLAALDTATGPSPTGFYRSNQWDEHPLTLRHYRASAARTKNPNQKGQNVCF
jgi:hypothetical protein